MTKKRNILVLLKIYSKRGDKNITYNFWCNYNIDYLFYSDLLTLNNKKKNFDINKKYGKAIVVGYSSESTDSFIEIMVKIPELNDNHTYSLQGQYNVKKLNGKTDYNYPYFNIGDEIEVIYAPVKIFGIKTVEVHLREDVYLKRGK